MKKSLAWTGTLQNLSASRLPDLQCQNYLQHTLSLLVAFSTFHFFTAPATASGLDRALDVSTTYSAEGRRPFLGG